MATDRLTELEIEAQIKKARENYPRRIRIPSDDYNWETGEGHVTIHYPDGESETVPTRETENLYLGPQGLQNFSLLAPKVPMALTGILSQAVKTGSSKIIDPLLNLLSRAPAAADSVPATGLPSLMARGSGEGFEKFGKRRGAGKSRVNQNLDGLISKFFAETRGGTRMDLASPYTLELVKANLPAIRAAAARQKQNPKAGLNRVIKLMDELE